MNSAKRLYDLFYEAKSSRSQEASYKLWIKIFQLDGEPAEQHEDIGSSCMTAIREELEGVSATLEDRGVPAELFRGGLDALRAIVSPTQFSAGWNHLADRVGQEHLMMLRWADWALDGSECEISQDERTKLIEDLDSLIAEFEASSIPRFTKELMLRHLNSVRKSLRVYRARGIDSVHAALNETIGAMSTRTSQVSADLNHADPDAKSIFGKAADMINRVVVVAEKAQKIQKGIDAGIQVAHQVEKIWAALPGMGS
ncbi:hypothetical protein ACI48D_08755 [Massilia sp. LXY-6]|uniref:hypothetical protein n=1 Tax=Massilia sp. LXY-6 TaxID=3379823 RepID=UPI003EDFDECF